eukprot:scaffold11824_cov125-Isochrysis_galbana.AAC.1
MAWAGPFLAVLAAERATLLEGRKHIKRELRVLDAEEQALLRWVPGQPLPMPDAVPEQAEKGSDGTSDYDEEWEADSAADVVETGVRASTGNAPGVGQRGLAVDEHEASDCESGSDWEEDLMKQLPEDSAWLREQPPSVLSTDQLGLDG